MIRTAVNEAAISGFGVGVLSGLRRAVAALARLIPQFNGVDNYATLDAPITFTGDFEVEAKVAIHDVTAAINLVILGSAASSTILYTNNSRKVLFRVDGFTISVSPTGVDPYDSGEHTWRGVRIGTTIYLYIDDILQGSLAASSNSVTWTAIGAYGAGLLPLKGHVSSVKYTDNSGTPVVIEHILDTKAPPGITYVSFDPVVDWHTYKEVNGLWAYQGSGTAGSQLMQFEGTATTPLSSSITVTGSTWEMNWEGLWVAHYISGAGAYTYVATPDGVPMRCNIEVMDDVTAYSMINEKTTVQSVDNALAAFAESVTRSARVVNVTLTGNSIPTAAGLANKAIIEAEGGTVLVDS